MDVLSPEAYCKAGGNQCPACHGTAIEGDGPVQTDSNIAWREAVCNTCHARWTDEFSLTGYRDLEEGDA